jgi:hypothetical protein
LVDAPGSGESQRKHFRAKPRHQNVSALPKLPLELAEVFFCKWFRKIVRQTLRLLEAGSLVLILRADQSEQPALLDSGTTETAR